MQDDIFDDISLIFTPPFCFGYYEQILCVHQLNANFVRV